MGLFHRHNWTTHGDHKTCECGASERITTGNLTGYANRAPGADPDGGYCPKSNPDSGERAKRLIEQYHREFTANIGAPAPLYTPSDIAQIVAKIRQDTPLRPDEDELVRRTLKEEADYQHWLMSA